MIRRKPLTRKKPIKRVGRLKPMSKAKAATMPSYRAFVRACLRVQIAEFGHHHCVKCKRNCRPEPHHIHGRYGTNLLRFVLICRECHEWIHSNPKAARAEGWLK